jgi:hypothetical protein
MKTHIIQLERHDDAISTRDKMMWGSSQRILLVFPERGSILTRRVDLVVLERHSQALGAQLALVTANTAVRQNARELGIPVFKSVIQAQKMPWRVPREIRRKFRRRPLQRPAEDLRLRRAEPSRELRLGERLIVFVLGVAAVLALVMFIMPGASVILFSAEQDQRLTMELWANPENLSPNLVGGIPARVTRVEVEGTETARSSGRVNLANQTATGEVTFTNLTDRDVLVPAGTIVRTQGALPVRFETTMDVVARVTEGEFVSAPIRAIAAGSSGNVPAGEIVAIEGGVGPLLTVTNLDQTSGGTDQSSSSPRQEDYDQVRQRVLEKMSQQAEAEMKSALLPETYLLSPSVKLDQIEYEDRQPGIGEPGEQFRLTVRASFTAWYIAAEDIRSAVLMALDANLPERYMDVPDSLRITLIGQPAVRDNQIGYQVEATRRLKASWTKEEVVHLVRGKDLTTAAQVLQERFILKSPPEFHMSPDWWPRLPYLPYRIQVGIQ